MENGPELLREAMAKARLTHGQTGRKIGVSAVSVYCWCSRRTRPKWQYREALRKLFGIPVEAWATPEELAPIGRAALASPSPDPEAA